MKSEEEVIFLVEESEEGGYIAKGIIVSIFSEAETMEELKEAAQEAVRCHFEDDQPRLIRFRMVNNEE